MAQRGFQLNGLVAKLGCLTEQQVSRLRPPPLPYASVACVDRQELYRYLTTRIVKRAAHQT